MKLNQIIGKIQPFVSNVNFRESVRIASGLPHVSIMETNTGSVATASMRMTPASGVVVAYIVSGMGILAVARAGACTAGKVICLMIVGDYLR